MALYVFDGTWNVDQPGTEHDTNAVWFMTRIPGPSTTAKESAWKPGP